MDQSSTDAHSKASHSSHASPSPPPQRIESDSVLRNSALLIGFHVLTKSLAFVSFILLAKYLGTQLFGVYNYAFALTSLFIPLCDLGMDTYLMREVPLSQRSRDPQTARSCSLLERTADVPGFSRDFTHGRFAGYLRH